MLGDWSVTSGINQYNIYYTNDDGQEGFWQNYGPASSSFGPVPNMVDIIIDSVNNYFIRQSSMFDGIVNVKWFGAIGDNLNDDTDAIQSALNFISETTSIDHFLPDQFHSPGGGTVFIPKGIFLIDKTLVIGYNCKILGVSNRSIKNKDFNVETGGSVIKCDFGIHSNEWAISTAAFYGNWRTYTVPIYTAGEFLPFDQNISAEGPLLPDVQNSYDNFPLRMGISIEGIIVDGRMNAFGGIRLANSPCSTIRNVGIINAKVGYMLNTSWYSSIENCFANSLWYGMVAVDCNTASIINCNFRGTLDDDGKEEGILHYVPLINSEELPDFIYQGSYASLGLNDNVKYGKTGVYAHNTQMNIANTGVEQMTIAFTLLNCSCSTIIGSYSESNLFYGVVTGMFTNLNVNGLILYSSDYGFLFGNNSITSINGISHFCINIMFGSIVVYAYIGQLFELNTATGRTITFSETKYFKRSYIKDIIFTDEGVNGQNYGAVYVNPTLGDDNNYGFNENDALQTFDAALIRIQNQSTKNPVKVVYLKAAPIIGQGIPSSAGAALKNLEIIPIENCDVMITTYGSDELHPRGRIFFTGSVFGYQVGQIELVGNVNLCFRNVDIFCNLPVSTPQVMLVNVTLFGLRSSYARVTFETLLGTPYTPAGYANIDMSNSFYLFQANYPAILTVLKSLLEVKFVNIVIGSGFGLSPIQNNNQDLGIDCTQIYSFRYTLNGWQDVIIIRNNF
ncbi:MAG: hypothetical protein H7296_16195 [Bacteroidia bacterium]|nr:hypothetical protein [Bacteroidia bacterium]